MIILKIISFHHYDYYETIIMNVPYYFFFHAVLKQTEKELQKCQQEIDEFETRVEEMSNSLRKKNDDEKSTAAALRALQKKVEKLQKQNDEVSTVKIVLHFSTLGRSDVRERRRMKCARPLCD